MNGQTTSELAAESSTEADSLLSIRDLSIEFDVGSSPVKAVRDVSFDITRGEIFGIVGESGSGKSTVALAIMRLLDEEGEISSGSIRFGEKELQSLSTAQMRSLRGDRISMVFQDPMNGLNPVMKIGDQVSEAIAATDAGGSGNTGTLFDEIARRLPGKTANREEVIDVLSRVGIPSPEDRLDNYPHEFSGGMRQRVMIAMAIAAEPELLIIDEPTTALDVTIQANILSLIQELRDTLDMTVLIISHNLSVIAQLCDRVAVLYAGQVMELGETRRVLKESRHPYTDGLRRSMPQLAEGDTLHSIPGSVPDLSSVPSGCIFKDRCPNVTAECEVDPPLERLDGRFVRCVNPVTDGDQYE